MLDQLRPPGVAALRVAKGVELEGNAFADAKLGQELSAKGEDFDIGGGLGGADDLGIELVELAEAALLRPLVTECRSPARHLERRMLLPAFGEIGAADASGQLGPKR